MQEKNLVVDVGIGGVPTLLRLRINEQYQRYGKILFPHHQDDSLHYIGLDINTTDLAKAKEYMEKYAPHISFETRCADFSSLPFPDNSCDRIILSDVLSIPNHDWCLCEGECPCRCISCECDGKPITRFGPKSRCCPISFKGVTDETKEQLLIEVARVLKKTGSLLVVNLQTPQYITPSSRVLKKLFPRRTQIYFIPDERGFEEIELYEM